MRGVENLCANAQYLASVFLSRAINQKYELRAHIWINVSLPSKFKEKYLLHKICFYLFVGGKTFLCKKT